jgi:uncharacterized protein YmfQ (DUF2313 family)
MPLLTFTAQDYAAQFQRLLPRGRIWHRGLGLVQDADILTLMPTWSRLQERLNDLIAEIFPCSTVELLPEWEATLGLPDPCTGPLDTIQERQAAVCSKFIARGGQSKTYYEAIAASIGSPITITEFKPFVAGDTVGLPLYGEDWAFTWQINAAQITIYAFSVGVSTAGEPLRTWSNYLLECTMEAIKPAHTVLLFAYYGTSPGEPPGEFILDQSALGGPDVLAPG